MCLLKAIISVSQESMYLTQSINNSSILINNSSISINNTYIYQSSNEQISMLKKLSPMICYMLYLLKRYITYTVLSLQEIPYINMVIIQI